MLGVLDELHYCVFLLRLRDSSEVRYFCRPLSGVGCSGRTGMSLPMLIFLCSSLLEREACEKCPALKSSTGNRFTSTGCRKAGVQIVSFVWDMNIAQPLSPA